MKTYQIEVNEQELKALLEGVELWQNEPSRSGVMGSIFGAILGPKKGTPGYEDYQKSIDDETRKQQSEIRQRKATSLRLQAKLLEVQDRAHEFTVENPTARTPR